MSAPVLDTHAWVWWVDRDRRLPRGTGEYLDGLGFNDRPYVADISLWEVAMLVDRGRLSFSVPLLEWLEAAAHRRSVRVVSVSPATAAEVAALPKSFHRDPADRLIVATCRTLKAPLLTVDRRILRAGLVEPFRLSRRTAKP